MAARQRATAEQKLVGANLPRHIEKFKATTSNLSAIITQLQNQLAEIQAGESLKKTLLAQFRQILRWLCRLKGRC